MGVCGAGAWQQLASEEEQEQASQEQEDAQELVSPVHRELVSAEANISVMDEEPRRVREEVGRHTAARAEDDTIDGVPRDRDRDAAAEVRESDSDGGNDAAGVGGLIGGARQSAGAGAEMEGRNEAAPAPRRSKRGRLQKVVRQSSAETEPASPLDSSAPAPTAKTAGTTKSMLSSLSTIVADEKARKGEEEALKQVRAEQGKKDEELTAQSANCNINANFSLNFLLKMQR